MNVIEANGARIPAIGLGTMTLKEQVCIDAVKAALKLGYRHIDTAERYGNEEWVGEGLHQGLKESGLKREDVFVTTKVYWDKLAPGDFETSVEDSLQEAQAAVGRPPSDPLEQSEGAARRQHQVAVQREEEGPGQARRRGELHHRDARRGDEALDRAAGDQPDRGASLPRPDARCWRPARSTACR